MQLDTIAQIAQGIHPNALAKLKVSMEDMSVENIGEMAIAERKIDMAKSRRPSKKRKTYANRIPEVDDIWKNLQSGKIDISYALAGYSYDGHPILNQDELVSLLINYGFSIQAVMPFIDEFAECAKDDPNGPIVMYSANSTRIVTEVEPIVGKK